MANFISPGDRLMAFERIKRTGETKLVGLAVASRIYPWTQLELDEWAHATSALPEKYKIYFSAHCLKKSNLFKKYNADYIYDVSIYIVDYTYIFGEFLGVCFYIVKQFSGVELFLFHPWC